LRVIVAGIEGVPPTGGVAVELDGVMDELAIAPYGVEVFGRSVPAVVRSLDPEDGSQIVNVVTATGAVQQIATDLTNAVVSAEGETIHVLAKRGADRVLFRYRGGTVDEVTLTGLAATTEEPQLFTTKEGAALISTSTTAFVVPSQSMTATAIAYHGLRSFVRGDATLVFTGAGLYSYGEVDGVPAYTLLTDDATDLLYAYPLDGYDGAVTKWFAYVKGGACVLARPDGAGATVTLAGNVSCLVGAVVDGVTRDDKLVVRAGNNIGLEQLFLLDGDAVTEVASSTSQIQLMYATKDSHVVLGWIGTDTTDQGFLCLGTHPERCWPAPGGARTWAAPVAGQPDAIHAVFLRQLTGAVELTSIKSIGSGTRSQPL
jgi:hypothetical protein